VLRLLRRSPPISPGYKTVILWGGLRGAVTLALGLAVIENPAIAPEAQRLVAVIATGFTLFTLLVQGTTLRWLIRRLGLDRLSPLEAALQKQVVAVALQTVREEVAEVTQRHGLTRATVRAEAKGFAERLDAAVAEAEAAQEILERDRLTLGLVTLAGREREMILEGFRERTISARLVERRPQRLSQHGAGECRAWPGAAHGDAAAPAGHLGATRQSGRCPVRDPAGYPDDPA
jgi:CPA1 family monovalent cation:H+ antiporter